jgi:hypothetical protein
MALCVSVRARRAQDDLDRGWHIGTREPRNHHARTPREQRWYCERGLGWRASLAERLPPKTTTAFMAVAFVLGGMGHPVRQILPRLEVNTGEDRQRFHPSAGVQPNQGPRSQH